MAGSNAQRIDSVELHKIITSLLPKKIWHKLATWISALRPSIISEWACWPSSNQSLWKVGVTLCTWWWIRVPLRSAPFSLFFLFSSGNSYWYVNQLFIVRFSCWMWSWSLLSRTTVTLRTRRRKLKLSSSMMQLHIKVPFKGAAAAHTQTTRIANKSYHRSTAPGVTLCPTVVTRD